MHILSYLLFTFSFSILFIISYSVNLKMMRKEDDLVYFRYKDSLKNVKFSLCLTKHIMKTYSLLN